MAELDSMALGKMAFSITALSTAIKNAILSIDENEQSTFGILLLLC
jgi:hypothetical protein